MPPTRRPAATASVFADLFGNGTVPRAQALAAGLSARAIRTCLEHGLLVAPRRGLLALPSTEPASHEEHEAAHRGRTIAALISVGHQAFATHESAAVVIGSARPSAQLPDAVQLAAPGIQDFSGPGLIVRGSDVPSEFVTVVDGIRVTDLRRTAVDLARGRVLPSALIPLDDAARRLIARTTGCDGNDLRRAVRDPGLRRQALAGLDAAVRSITGWQGVVAARHALTFAEPAAESPLESRSRGWFIRAGLRLETGVPLQAAGHEYWADFVSREHGVIGEADGLGKYGESIHDVRRRLAYEKARQADLEAEGWRFVRWTTADAERDVVRRMSAALRSD